MRSQPGSGSRETPQAIQARMKALACLLLFGFAGCHHARPSRYVEGADACSMVPVTRQCRCDGTERAPTREEAQWPVCGQTLMMCDGEVHDCVDVARASPLSR